MCDRFSMFPHQLLRAGLSRHELLVLLCLLSYRNGDGQAWPYRATIAEDTGINVRHVHSAVKSLTQKGMIAMDTQAGVRTVYTFPYLDGAAFPVIAESATTATEDNLSHVAKTEGQAVPAESIAQLAPDMAAPTILPAPVVAHEPPENAPQAQGELLPVPVKRRRIKSAAVQGELLPASEPENSKGRCLPKDWQLPRSWGIWAMEELGFTEDEVRYQADKFRDHWVSTTRNPAKKDWPATWRNWMRGENEKKQRYNNRCQQKSKTLQAIEALTGKSGLDFEIPF